MRVAPRVALCGVLTCIVFAHVAAGQTLPATAPSTVLSPPGFERFTVSGRTFIAEPGETAWISEAAAKVIHPATTRPADLVTQFVARRDDVKKTILADLPMLAAPQVDAFFDGELLPLMNESTHVAPNLVFLVAPLERVKQALRGGWTDRRVHYNRASDGLEITRPITLDMPGRTDESVLFVVYTAGDAPQKRTDALVKTLSTADAQTVNTLIVRATSLMTVRFGTFIADKALSDLPRGDDQLWLPDGLSTVLATKYVAMIHGSPQAAFVHDLLTKPIDPRVNAAAIDLLHPLPADQLLPELVLPYAAARHEKNVAAMYLWLLNGGAGKIADVVDAVKKQRPADGPTLAKVLAAAGGVELTTALGPKSN